MNLLTNHALLAFGMPGGADLMIIAVMVLVLFGAKKLPLFARSMGRSLGEFKKAKEEFEQELHNAADESALPPPRPRAPEPKPAVEEQKPVAAAPVASTTQS